MVSIANSFCVPMVCAVNLHPNGPLDFYEDTVHTKPHQTEGVSAKVSFNPASGHRITPSRPLPGRVRLHCQPVGSAAGGVVVLHQHAAHLELPVEQ